MKKRVFNLRQSYFSCDVRVALRSSGFWLTCWCACCVAVLDVQAFERLLGPCKNLMQRNIADYEQRLTEIFGEPADIGDLR